MKNLKVYSFLLLVLVISCGKDEPKQKAKKSISSIQTPKATATPPPLITSPIDTGLNQVKVNNYTASHSSLNSKTSNKTLPKKTQHPTNNNKPSLINNTMDSPLRNLLKNGQIGKSYTKNELIANFKFPKEAVDLIKHVTYIGQNKLYFKWGSTWFVEKVSDAEFKNDTLVFVFKQNRTYVSGGAIGIKYNKKIYTELILNNGAAYIPTVKGYHWDIGK
ncbi:hypothetical protein [Flavobacterium sp.]|uniref:hypothetical protein n=1 Tax=Flavobacterium sp. TaxID=239 RepID=UPI002C52EBA9|nr:hypothetical protein [Flavobacterium sp.]HSD06260.1 hypothetical protein [Flavobacterium sp.]